MATNRRAAKRLQKENHSVKPNDDVPSSVNGISTIETSASEVSAVPDEPGSSVETVHPLMVEVESFLCRRDELARKLAVEIEATEKKLAELKKTAASLFPENAGGGKAEQKSKKHKAKASSREAKSESANPVEPVSMDATS